MSRTIVALVAALCFAAASSVRAQSDVASFYRGKTLTIVVGSTAGGGYDVNARLLSRYLGKYIPGAPSVIVSNMPGAGGNVAGGYVARIAAKDGTYIAALSGSQPLDPILQEGSDLKYDPSAMNWLGTVGSDNFLCVVRSNAPATKFDEIFKTEIIVGGSGESGPARYLPTVMNNVLGTKFRVVSGYPGTREIMLAMQKDEVNGLCGPTLPSWKLQYPGFLQSGDVKPLVQMNEKGQTELNELGVPRAITYARDERQRRILDIIFSQQVFARPYFVAAEVPMDRVEALRRAFMAAWKDKDLLVEGAKLNIEVEPLPGEEVQKLLQKIYASPPDLLQSVREATKAM